MQEENEKYRMVVYRDKEYIIMYTYDSGYCELKESNGWNFLLVPEAELSVTSKK
jgi:hypothetical protein